MDLDADGDVEMATAEVDFGVGNLTRAMLTQKIRVDILYRPMREGRYGDDAVSYKVTFDDAVANGLYERVCMMRRETPTPGPR